MTDIKMASDPATAPVNGMPGGRRPRRTARLEDILVRRGQLAPEQAADVRRRATEHRVPIRALLAEAPGISDDTLALALAEQYGVDYDPLTDHRVDDRWLQRIPLEWMQRCPFVPLRDEAEAVVVAVQDPGEVLKLDDLERKLRRPCVPIVSTRAAILAALQRSQSTTQAMQKLQVALKQELIAEGDDGEERLSLDTVAQDDSPVVALVNTIVLTALERRASDIHIEPNDHGIDVKYRIDGVLYRALEPLDLQYHASLVSRLKIMSELDIAEQRVPQDGRFKLRVERRKVDFRVSILPTAAGEAIVVRVLDKDAVAAGLGALRLDRMGFSGRDLVEFRRAITEPYGMVLVTGPTGSGKTTSLYAAINEINTQEDKIVTIEDPVEYQLKGIVQIPVNEKKGLTFARGLRSILRHDPDKIMVGEIRDAETAQIAIQSALTGHLVFSTVHANNACDVVGRFLNMGVDVYNFVSAVNSILAQRLVRLVCGACRRRTTAPIDLCAESGLEAGDIRGWQWSEGAGCTQCHGLGYRGRTAITEFLDVNDRIKDMILNRATPADIRRAAVESGMTTLRESGLRLVAEGATTLKEVNRVTRIR